MLGAKSLLTCLMMQACLACPGRGPFAACRQHFNTVYRARWQAQGTARALVGYDRVHEFIGANNGVDRTGLDTQRTAYAMRFIDLRHE